jgi:hypothetical protein
MGMRLHIPVKQDAVTVPQPLAPAPFATLQRKCACGGSAGAAGGCDECNKKKKTLQRRAINAAGHATVPPIVHDVLRSPGEPLDATARAFMEPRFGHDFSRVRVHVDSRAAESARAVNALAYTVGRNVVFGAGQYSPGTAAGNSLLAHELTHVLQQSGGGEGLAALRVGSIDSPSEREADQVAKAVVLNQPSARPTLAQRSLVQRQPAPPAPSPAAACPAAKQSQKMSACVQVVVIANKDQSNPTTAPSLAAAQGIWGKCCIDLTASSGTTVNDSYYKILQESTGDAPTPEEAELFRAAGASSCIQVFVPELFLQGGKNGKDISGGGHTFDLGTAHPKIVIVEGAAPEVLAHEIGHAMGVAHVNTPTVMKPTNHYNVPNAAAVSAAECSKAKTGGVVVKKGGAKDCCMDY